MRSALDESDVRLSGCGSIETAMISRAENRSVKLPWMMAYSSEAHWTQIRGHRSEIRLLSWVRLDKHTPLRYRPTSFLRLIRGGQSKPFRFCNHRIRIITKKRWTPLPEKKRIKQPESCIHASGSIVKFKVDYIAKLLVTYFNDSNRVQISYECVALTQNMIQSIPRYRFL
jgi:hypothetical protein